MAAETFPRQQWILPRMVDVSARLVEAAGGDALIAQILAGRGFTSPDAARAFLDPASYRPAPPADLPGLVQACALLEEVIRVSQTILIWGDFDVDGQTATALLVTALQNLGAHVTYFIPDRNRDGHGIALDRLRERIEMHDPAVLLTCDTGISERGAVAAARRAGITTVITDHHALPDHLPEADVIVNPALLPAGHPLATLPGVGVAYKLIEHLYAQFNRSTALAQFLDLVALGIVADVAVQTGDTRYLLQMGLRHLQNAPRPGLRALADVAGLEIESLSAMDIAFDLAPRLNAAGRLADASIGVDLLLTADLARARILAAQVDGLNRQRRALQADVYANARQQLTINPALAQGPALLLGAASWHPGVIGSAAGQLAEAAQRPAFFYTVGDDGLLRGSARSVPGIDVHAALIAAQDLLVRFGGHSGAAGFTLRAEDLPAFQARLFEALAIQTPSAERPTLTIDAVVSLAELTPQFADRVQRLGPFGEGNPPVTFLSTDLSLKSAAFLDRAQQHRRLTIEDPSGARQSLIWWRGGEQTLPDSAFDAALQIDLRTRAGTNAPQLVLIDYRRAATAAAPSVAQQRDIIDCRNTPDPARTLEEMRQRYPESAVWAEGYRTADSPGRACHQLDRAPTLIVYTVPPGSLRMQDALARVQPERVILIGAPPLISTFTDAQRRLLELCKYVISRQAGRTTLDDLAGALAQTPAAVRSLLLVVEAQGDIEVSTPEDAVMIAPGAGATAKDLNGRTAQAQAIFSETAAYRTFFRQASPSAILEWEQV